MALRGHLGAQVIVEIDAFILIGGCRVGDLDQVPNRSTVRFTSSDMGIAQHRSSPVANVYSDARIARFAKLIGGNSR